MKSIFIFSEFYYPDLLSSGYYLTEIAENLALNRKVTVITTGEDSKQTTEIRNNVSIIRIPKKNFNKNILLQRLIKFIYLSFHFYLIGRKKIEKNTEVICVTNPALFVPVIAYLKKRRNFNLSYFVHDVFPENLVAIKIIKSINPFYKLIYLVFNKSYFQANRIITCGRDMKLHFEQKLPGYLGEIFFIPNWGETDKIIPDKKLRDETLMELNIHSKFVFQFAGNLGRGQGINNLLDAVKMIDEPRAHFLFFGKGTYENELKRCNQDQKITYGGSFERGQSNKFLNACDVSIVSLQEGMLGLGVPSKTYNILSAGKPILYIGEKTSEIGLLIEENNIGRICQSGSIVSIVEGINWFLSKNQNEINEISQKARNISFLFSKKKILNEYMNLFIE